MGIKGLWSVLTPFSDKKSLHEIRGETLAVDLSGWVCDSQNVTEYHIQPKLYLRNLFFRTVYLLLADIEPIFVLEGDAPELKRDVMASRNAIQFRGAAPKSDKASKKPPDVARKRFKGVLKECENLLKCMGVRCVKGSGEAEATCAQLNAQGLVDAVVSQDSDSFAYGARRVYRNFSVSSAAGGGAMQGSVDCYDADVMFNSNGFGRNKMVALALLCGCDYGVGACGTSINTVVSFLHTIPENDIIPRLLTWVSDPDYYEKQNRWLSAPGRCDKCGHFGKPHTKNGCPVCVTAKGCNDTGHKTKAAEVKRELSLRNRAMNCGVLFPEPLVMQEFLNLKPDSIDLDTLKKPTPSLIQFVKLMSFKLDWSERYCVEKFLPLLTKWHLQDKVPVRTIKPVHIKKKRTPKGVPSYEVVWDNIDGHYEALIPDDQYDDDEDRSLPWTSIERQDLMRKYYPNLVESFEESIKKPTKEKKTRAKKTKKVASPTTDKPKRKYTKKVKKLVDLEVHNLSESMRNVSLNSKAPVDLNSSRVSVSINKLKRKMKHSKGKQKTIDSFISKKRKSNRKSTQVTEKSLSSVSKNNDCFFDAVLPENEIDIEYDYPVPYYECNEMINKTTEIEQTDNENKCMLKEIYNEVAESDLPYNECYNMMNKTNEIEQNDKENKSVHFLSLLGESDDEIAESDLSDIVDRIVNTAPRVKTAKVNSNFVKLVFESKFSTPIKKHKKSVLQDVRRNNCSTPNESPIRRKSYRVSRIEKVNTSYFFDKLTENDAFEMSVEYNQSKNVIIDCDATVEYSLPVDCTLPDVCV